MQIAEQWLNDVGEAVAADMFSPDSGAPGYRTEAIIKAIQADAREDLKSAIAKIAAYPIHSEPMGGAMDMQDIATNALAPLTLTLTGKCKCCGETISPHLEFCLGCTGENER